MPADMVARLRRDGPQNWGDGLGLALWHSRREYGLQSVRVTSCTRQAAWEGSGHSLISLPALRGGQGNPFA